MQKNSGFKNLTVFGVLIGLTLALATPALAGWSGTWTPTAIVCDGDTHTITITGDVSASGAANVYPVTTVQVNGGPSFDVAGGSYAFLSTTITGVTYTYSDATTFNPGDTVAVVAAYLTNGLWDDGSYMAISLTTTCAGGGLTDGRINTEPWGRVAIYCDQDTFSVYSIDADGAGHFLYEMDFNAPPTHPAVNTLVRNDGDVWLFRLTSGEWEIVRGPDSEGKFYAFVFSECAISYNNYDASFAP